MVGVTRFRLHALRCILSACAFLAAPPRVPADGAIRINGSGAPLEMMIPLMEAYGKEVRGVSFQMEKPLGTSGAIKAVLAGVIDIAVVSRALKPEEEAQGARLRDYGKTPMAVVTEKNVPVLNLTVRELEDIYSGKTGKWPDGETVRVVLRPNEDTDTKILKGLSPGMAAAIALAQKRRGVMTAVTDPESNEAVSGIAGGIGAAGLCSVLDGDPPLRILALNGILPGRETLADGTYPLFKEIGFATTGRLPDAAGRFLDFIYSDSGRAIAESTGVWITADGK